MSPGRDTGLGPARQPPRADRRDESRPPVLPVLAIQPGPLCRTSRGSPPAGRVWRLAPDACYLSADRAGLGIPGFWGPSDIGPGPTITAARSAAPGAAVPGP